MPLRMLTAPIRRVGNRTAGTSFEPHGRSSRTYTHTLPVLVVPRPGSSPGSGVSSPWTLLPPSA